MIHNHIMKLIVFILFINALVKSQPLTPAGKQTTAVKSSPTNPFAPNSAIFKIPVFKTINLDFTNANNARIQSELLRVLKDSLQKKELKQEKIIINVKPPKGSNSSFTKRFTSLLRSDTIHVVPGAVVGAKSTVFKKKNGEIIKLRLTLYVIREKKPIPIRKPLKIASLQSNTTKTSTEKAYINTTQLENITATVETVLKQLYENSTENGETNRTDIFLRLISSTNFTTSKINNLKKSIKQISENLYPNSTISIKTSLLYGRKTGTSKVEFEIDIQPRLSESSLKPPPTKFKHVDNTKEARKVPKNESKSVGNIKEADWKRPKNELNTKEPSINSINLTIKSWYYNGTKPTIRYGSINGTKSVGNTTASIEYLLKTKFENITGKDVNSTYINLNIIPARNLSTNHRMKTEQSIDQLIHKVFAQSAISSQTRLQYDQNRNISFLNFTVFLTPKYQPKKIQEATRQKLNLTVISTNKETPQSLLHTLNTLKKDLQKLIPDSQLLIQARKEISEDLGLLTKELQYREKEPNRVNILMDLTKTGANFDTEFDKVLPHLLETVNASSKSVVLAFRIAIPKDPERSSISSDVCSLLKKLTSKIPEKTRFGDLDIELTILPDSREHLQTKHSNFAPVLANIKPPLKSASSTSPNLPNIILQNPLNLTEPGINITHTIKATLAEHVRQIPFSKSSDNQFNISLIIPQNQTNLFVENILNIMKQDLKILLPYSQILIQDQDLIAKDLHILKLSIGPLHDIDRRQEKNTQVIQIDLSELGQNVPKELDDLLEPLWSNIAKERPSVFDLKLRPVNDIDRRRLGNDICSIVDVLTESLPEEISLNNIILQTTILPDKSVEVTSEHLKEQEIPTKLLELTDSGEKNAKRMHISLREFVKELENFENPSPPTKNVSLVLQLSGNGTRENIEETIRIIKDDLLKLVPYSDVLTKTRKSIKDELHKLELTINQAFKKPIKEFKIELNKFGETLPEQVDEVVYDIRHLDKPFSFDLNMVLPEDVDLETASSEICSVSNVVINNIAKQSYLTGTILRLIVSPENEESSNSIQKELNPIEKIKKIKPLKNQLGNEKTSPRSSLIEDFLPTEGQPQKRKLADDNEESISDYSEEPKKIPDDSEEEIKIPTKTPKRIINSKTSYLPNINKYLTSSSFSPLRNRVSIPLYDGQQINPYTKVSGEKSYPKPSPVPKTNEKPAQQKTTKSIQEGTEVIPVPKTVKPITSSTENGESNYEVNSEFQPSSTGIYEGATSNCVIPEFNLENLSSTSENVISVEEATNAQPRIRNQKISETEAPEEEDKSEEEKPNYITTEENRLDIETELIPTKKESGISKRIQGINESILKGIGTISSAIKSIGQGRSTENPVSTELLSISTPPTKIDNSLKKRIPHPVSVPKNAETKNSHLKNTKPDITNDVESFLKKIISPPRNIPQIKSVTENIPLIKLYPENAHKIKSFLQRRVSHSTIKPTENIALAKPYSENTDEIKEFTSLPPKKSKTRRYRTKSNKRKDDDKASTPKFDEGKIKTIPIRAFSNDEDNILQYIENLDLSKPGTNVDESIRNLATSIIQIIPRNDQTLELILNIKPPRNTTVDSLKNITNSVLSSLVSSLPNDIVNIGTKVTKNEDNVLIRAQMKITISNNDDIIKQIKDQEHLKNKFENESRMIQNLSQILQALTKDVKQELNVQNQLENTSENKTEKTSIEDIESFLKESLHSIVSEILLTIGNSSEPQDLNLTYSLNAPAVLNQNFADHFGDLLKAILFKALPFEDVSTEAKSLKNDTNSALVVLVNLEPRTVFTTSPIDLDDLNILDVESVLTKIISNYITGLGNANVYKNRIVINFIFETSRISSLNLENIESAIDDVFTALNLKGVLITKDIKLGLTKKNEIIMNLPYVISTLNFKERSSPDEIQEVKTPKPLEMISDLILPI